MKPTDLFELALFLVLLTALTPPLGAYLHRLFRDTEPVGGPAGAALERFFYRFSEVRPGQGMNWRQYAGALMVFNLLGVLVVFLFQLWQHALPLNPAGLPAVSWHSALNTAVSFVTNTNWQGYAGETTMSHLTQMMALTVQNFVSAATGLAVAVVVARGIARKNTRDLGNFWVDLVRGVLFLLLPASVILGLVLVGEGVVQNFSAATAATTLEGVTQTIPLGPAASQIAIKMLGTNGGGFFNANAAHPFENPTPLSNFLQMLAIFVIPAALTSMYGRMTGSRRHGWVIFGVMAFLFAAFTFLSLWSESVVNPLFGTGSLMEGKETRFGVFNSILFSIVTTAASCGAVNAMHASLSPLSGGLALLNMQLGEVIFGGVGAGLYGMFLFILLTVFLAGLMVGRTPEYLGKKIEAAEMRWVILAIVAPSAMILLGTAISVLTPAGLSSLANGGPHGLSEILYAFTSAAANNGSAFAGLNANTVYYNLMLAAAMFVGRFAVILPVLAIAGGLAAKKQSPSSAGSFEVDTGLFAVLLTGVILIVGGLTFFPVMSLGPIVEHFLLLRGQSF
ncbi:MAG: potassium-transporting ATPase subunit KdpA [Bdellovibrionaceae bacterium]|nr:potassium-transporting ATPase subunit KdpA [Pseudobdellovibrionaceae bacterium]MBX3033523.1 potassium-transporting ATPase subunit KdpA [Pseudobdellovibrionaceae bacterium]